MTCCNAQAKPAPSPWVTGAVVAPPSGALTADNTTVKADDTTHTIDEN